jgi:hypothetical protein
LQVQMPGAAAFGGKDMPVLWACPSGSSAAASKARRRAGTGVSECRSVSWAQDMNVGRGCTGALRKGSWMKRRGFCGNCGRSKTVLMCPAGGAGDSLSARSQTSCSAPLASRVGRVHQQLEETMVQRVGGEGGRVSRPRRGQPKAPEPARQQWCLQKHTAPAPPAACCRVACQPPPRTRRAPLWQMLPRTVAGDTEPEGVKVAAAATAVVDSCGHRTRARAGRHRRERARRHGLAGCGRRRLRARCRLGGLWGNLMGGEGVHDGSETHVSGVAGSRRHGGRDIGCKALLSRGLRSAINSGGVSDMAGGRLRAGGGFEEGEKARARAGTPFQGPIQPL